jgi:hypothetical protein
MAGIALIPESAGGGLKTVEDLYNLINGSTRTTSGGTQTTVESSGVSKETMDALMKSALDSTTGLAAVSSGQRAAGGYGSSVNQMLTNDLLARTAQQIAASNKTSTRVVTSTPQVQKIGGITAGGTAKTAGFLGALKFLETSGASGWLKKNLNLDGSGSGPVSTPVASPIDQNEIDRANTVLQTPQENPSSSFNYSQLSTGFDSVTAGDNGYTANAGVDVTPVVDQTPITPVDLPPVDDFYIPGAVPFADGGAVRKKSLLGEDQSNSYTEIAGDPGSLGSNPAASASVASSPSLASSATTIVSGGRELDRGGDTAPSTGTGSSSPSSDFGFSPFGGSGVLDIAGIPVGDLNTASKAAGALGGLLGNSDLSQAGLIGSIATSNNPGMALAVAGANKATGGIAGSVMAAINDPTLATLIDVVVGKTPIGPLNSLAGLLTGVTLGQIAENARAPEFSRQMAPPDLLASEKASRTQSGENVPVTDATPVPVADIISQAPVEAAPTVDPVADFGIDPGSIDAGAAGDSGGIDSGGGGNDGGAGPQADGGHITGPGTGTSDSIPAKLSAGEYVLPADVVAMIGIEKLDKMVDKYHTPAAVQRLKAFANGGRVTARM